MYSGAAPSSTRICTARAVRFKIYGWPDVRKESVWVGSASWTRSNYRRFSDCPITWSQWPISAWVTFGNFRMDLNSNVRDGGEEFRCQSSSITTVGKIEPILREICDCPYRKCQRRLFV